MNSIERHHIERVASLVCCVCRRSAGWHNYEEHLQMLSRVGHIHHVAEGSGERSNFSICKLCYDHHEGPNGLHGAGTKAFIRMYRPPGDSEYGLLVWTNEDLAELDLTEKGLVT